MVGVNFAEIFAEGQSRRTTEAIVDFVGDDPRRFAELFRSFKGGDHRQQQCAAWPMSVIAEKNPELVEPYLPKLLEYLPRNDVHDAVRRSVLRLLQFVTIPKRLKGKVYSYCVDLIDDPNEPVAVRCFALSAAVRAADGEPVLMNEIELVVNRHIDDSTAGFRARVRRVFSKR